jgi:hypothetical protein
VAWGSATLQIYNTFYSPSKRVSLLNHLADFRLFTGIAFAGHTGATVAADLFIPSLLRVILANPADAVTDRAIRVCHEVEPRFLEMIKLAKFGRSPWIVSPAVCTAVREWYQPPVIQDARN